MRIGTEGPHDLAACGSYEPAAFETDQDNSDRLRCSCRTCRLRDSATASLGIGNRIDCLMTLIVVFVAEGTL